MTEASKTIKTSLSVDSLRRCTSWTYFDYYQQQYIKVVATLVRECRKQKDSEVDKAIEDLISRNSNEKDAVEFTDGLVQRGVKYGWALIIRMYGTTVAERSGAVEITTS